MLTRGYFVLPSLHARLSHRIADPALPEPLVNPGAVAQGFEREIFVGSIRYDGLLLLSG